MSAVIGRRRRVKAVIHPFLARRVRKASFANAPRHMVKLKHDLKSVAT
jgi:hypothetical protein